MIAFKKPKKNFRKKTTTDENDEDQTSEQKDVEHDSIGLNKSSQKKNSEKSKPAIAKSRSSGLLSFEDELEEGEEFVLKKSKESRKLAQRLREQKKKEKLGEIHDNVKSTLPLVDNSAEKLADRKAEQSMKSRMIVGGDSDEDDDNEDGGNDEGDDFNDIRSGMHFLIYLIGPFYTYQNLVLAIFSLTPIMLGKKFGLLPFWAAFCTIQRSK